MFIVLNFSINHNSVAPQSLLDEKQHNQPLYVEQMATIFVAIGFSLLAFRCVSKTTEPTQQAAWQLISFAT
jgi:hypothetical protein